MTFTFSQPLKILAIGGSLITSSSLWFFNPSFNDSQIQTRSRQPSEEVRDHDNLNVFTAVKKLENRNGTSKKYPNFRVKSNDGRILKFTLDGDDQEKTLNYSSFPDLNNLEVGIVLGYKSEYASLDKSSINISLFKQPVWKNNTEDDVYDTQLSREQINNLFKDLDETKTKQLLLSLEKRIEWKRNGDNNYYPQIHHQQSTGNLDDLKNLKIKYFTDYEELKKYIKEKVTSCTNPREACVAHLDELDLMETDTYSSLKSASPQ